MRREDAGLLDELLQVALPQLLVQLLQLFQLGLHGERSGAETREKQKSARVNKSTLQLYFMVPYRDVNDQSIFD